MAGVAFFHSSKFHKIMMIVWPIALVPMYVWARESVFLVIFLSVYANWVGHFGAYQAARSEEKQ